MSCSGGRRALIYAVTAGRERARAGHNEKPTLSLSFRREKYLENSKHNGGENPHSKRELRVQQAMRDSKGHERYSEHQRHTPQPSPRRLRSHLHVQEKRHVWGVNEKGRAVRERGTRIRTRRRLRLVRPVVAKEEHTSRTDSDSR